ncbi:2-deoxystreptamine N-acetyl-D-glucosaminyltransferase [Sedimentisphaera cyanobacteriorum]|uniref:2-deoxystreptamine N-acetyl-D-glucosaminyltransferase n=1 Tax=Sedimentisphaera cyanobacteriorum TaxID=1940790 RepID=A0A1Q2HSP3_9BACT|nr:glycosyltransferase family 4 protein [Sedimentisphaera cyanobacteriorum]AQQ10351.1 2-deoxystreptamine N-acetyl-D-glucosaminyltransferase [Sedimentisphaera cyanobacteriorum]
MNIVHVITRLIVGGAQENTIITCREQVKRGHNVTLITGPSPGPEGDLMEQAEKEEFDLILQPDILRPILPLTDMRAYTGLKELLKSLKPDIVHTHSAKAGILGRLAGWNIKDESSRPAVVHTIHGLAFHEYQNPLLSRMYIEIEKFAAKKCDAIISVADTMTRKCLANGIGSPELFSTAYSAVDVEDFQNPPSREQSEEFCEKYSLGKSSTVAACIARITELKGHNYIIEAAERLVSEYPDLIWLLVGNGSLTEKIKADIERAGLSDNFRFTGLLQPSEIPLAIHCSDFLVHCSLREGLARVLPQAMLCGKPVVSFDIDGAAEVVNENTGRLIAPMDIEGLTRACSELAESPQLREQLGAAGRELAVKLFSPGKMLESIENAYRRAGAAI